MLDIIASYHCIASYQSYHTPSFTKSEKANDPILRKLNAERMDRQTVRRKERQTDRQD